MTDEEKLEEMVEDMYQNYIHGGFDFNTNDTFDIIFKRIFSDAVHATLNVLESQQKEKEEECIT